MILKLKGQYLEQCSGSSRVLLLSNGTLSMFLTPVIVDGVCALVKAGGAGSGFNLVQCQRARLKIPARLCLTVLYGQESWLDVYEGRKGFFPVHVSLIEFGIVRMLRDGAER